MGLDVTGGLADKLPAILNPAIEKLLTAVTGVETTAQTVEASALAAFHDEAAAALTTATGIVPQIDAVLTNQRAAFFAELDKRLNGLTLTNKLTYPGSTATL